MWVLVSMMVFKEWREVEMGFRSRVRVLESNVRMNTMIAGEGNPDESRRGDVK